MLLSIAPNIWGFLCLTNESNGKSVSLRLLFAFSSTHTLRHLMSRLALFVFVAKAFSFSKNRMEGVRLFAKPARTTCPTFRPHCCHLPFIRLSKQLLSKRSRIKATTGNTANHDDISTPTLQRINTLTQHTNSDLKYVNTNSASHINTSSRMTSTSRL
jgi:hypothetical protein